LASFLRHGIVTVFASAVSAVLRPTVCDFWVFEILCDCILISNVRQDFDFDFKITFCVMIWIWIANHTTKDFTNHWTLHCSIGFNASQLK